MKFSPICKFMNCQLMRVRSSVLSVRHLHKHSVRRRRHWHVAATVIEWSILAHSVQHFVYQQQQHHVTTTSSQSNSGSVVVVKCNY